MAAAAAAAAKPAVKGLRHDEAIVETGETIIIFIYRKSLEK